jgi:dTDP-3-amino-3,4,6-trideoxy-alpha-D-glucose transaminase
MTVRFLDLRRRLRALGGELDRALGAVLEDGRLILGPAVEAFEEAFAAACGVRHTVGVASGTDALSIALAGVGVGAGDEVITAANTCVPTVAAIEAAGADPVLVDPDPRTFTLTADAVADAVGPRTRAVVPVHLYGHPADLPALASLASERGLKLVGDAAQAHGASVDGVPVGAWGDACAFSFYPTKNLGAIGDGGAVVTNDAAVAERARMLRSYGQRDGSLSQERGRNSRLDSVQAAALLVALPRLPGWNARRREIANRYRAALEGSPLVLPAVAPGTDHVFHLFVVRVSRREALRAELSRQGVETGVHYPHAIHEHPAYAQLGRSPGGLAVSEQLAREVLSLPLYPELSDDEVARVAGALLAALAGLELSAPSDAPPRST